MGEFLRDLRYAARLYRRRPGFSTVTTLLIALGIAANTVIFSVVDTLLLRPLPVSHPEELVRPAHYQRGLGPRNEFLHYNLLRAKRLLTAQDYRRVADAVPNLAATKNTGTTVLSTAELMKVTPEIQHFFGEAMFPTGCLHGTCSVLSSFAPM